MFKSVRTILRQPFLSKPGLFSPRFLSASHSSFADIAFNPVTSNPEKLNEILERQKELRKKIAVNEANLAKMYLEQNQTEKELMELKAPAERYQKAQKSLEKLTETLTELIYNTLLNNEKSEQLPHYIEANNAFLFIKPILEGYGFRFTRSDIMGQGEIITICRIIIPDQIRELPLQVLSNPNQKYSIWLNSFDKLLRSSIEIAENLIDKQFNVLKKQLIEPLLNGSGMAFTEIKVCNAAIARLKEYAKKEQMLINQQGNALLAEPIAQKQPEI